MTETSDVPASVSTADKPLDGHRIVQRTVIRPDQELDIRPLYIGGISSYSAGESTARQSGEGERADPTAARDDSASGSVEAMGSFGRVAASGGATVRAERRLTFGTYFNAFPASYWRRWTDLDSVRLVIQARGAGTVIVYRSTAKGHVQRADAREVSRDSISTLVFDLPLKPFIDGGWYWFDIEAGEAELTVHEAVWGFETERRTANKLSIGITTFNRPEFCVDQLVNLANEPSVLEIIDEIIVVDQGTQMVSDHPLYAETAATLGPKLRLIEQGNLGGSGGFSRAMMETADRGEAAYVLLLDDDVVCEPEGILRAVAFADLAKQPTIVGGQMFSLYDRSVLHAYGEAVAKYRWFWGAAPNTEEGHNFANKSLRATQWLHRRVDVDYNGWWMCLIPVSVIRDVGLSLPMFIKWDDAEFGLRAGEAGYPTVTMPGVAVWHVPWHEKDDTIDWQAYFHRRNRLVAALLHSPYDRGGRLILESFETQVKHVLSMQYGPAEMGLLAIEDILDGPERMHRDVLERLPHLREMRQHYDDSLAQPDLDKFPSARRLKPPRRGKEPTAPTGKLGRAKTLATSAVRQFLPVRHLSRDHPEANVPHIDLRWWLLAQLDSALVSTADGTAAAWYKRDPHLSRDLMQRSMAVHARLTKEWPDLAQRYKSALPELTAPDTWRKTFEQSGGRDS